MGNYIRQFRRRHGMIPTRAVRRRMEQQKLMDANIAKAGGWNNFVKLMRKKLGITP